MSDRSISSLFTKTGSQIIQNASGQSWSPAQITPQKTNAEHNNISILTSDFDIPHGLVTHNAENFPASSQIRYATPDESNLHVEDDAPLCSNDAQTKRSSHSRTTKKAKAGFRLPKSKKIKKSRQHELTVVPPSDSLTRAAVLLPKIHTNQAVHLPGYVGAGDPLDIANITTDFLEDTYNGEQKKGQKKCKNEKKKAKKKSSKKSEKFMPGSDLLSLSISSKSGKRRSKRSSEIEKNENAQAEMHSNMTVFGVPLMDAIERSPSYDGVPLPSFFRYCIDFIDEYGLAVEGIYRVPGVNSQVMLIINALNHGMDFHQISPSSPTYVKQTVCRKMSGKKLSPSDSPSPEPGSDLPASPSSTTMEVMASSMLAASRASPSFLEGTTSPPLAKSDLMIDAAPPPHDPAVITSVIKTFLRSLPEPVLTARLTPLAEAACDLPDAASQMRRLGELVHSNVTSDDFDSVGCCLPRENRYLLAWLLQHMNRVIDRSADNKMTLANLIIVLSPTLGMSHRLLALLLSDASVFGSVLPNARDIPGARRPALSHIAPHSGLVPHWLFPDSAFAYRPYVPPLPLATPRSSVDNDTGAASGFELPDSPTELEEELFKQESLLAFTLRQIVSGKTDTDKEALIWEVQHLVTKMKRKKALLELTDPIAIRAELSRHEAQLERVQQELMKSQVPSSPVLPHSATALFHPSGINANKGLHSPKPKISTHKKSEISAVKASNSRRPVSQFDFAKWSKVQSCAEDAIPSMQPETGTAVTAGSSGLTNVASATPVTASGGIPIFAMPSLGTNKQKPHIRRDSVSLDAELWELQRIVTLLKRRLKMQLKSSTNGSFTDGCHIVAGPPIPAESLDTEEVLNFTLRKPQRLESFGRAHLSHDQPERLTPAAGKITEPNSETATSDSKTVITQTSTAYAIPDATNFSPGWSANDQPGEFGITTAPFFVDWSIAPSTQANTQATGVSAASATVVTPSTSPLVATMGLSADTSYPISSHNLEANENCLLKGQQLQQQKVTEMMSDPMYQQLVSSYCYWQGRMQELTGIQHDLHSRIRSQKAEITRIQTSIERLVASGGKQAKCVHDYFMDDTQLMSLLTLGPVTIDTGSHALLQHEKTASSSEGPLPIASVEEMENSESAIRGSKCHQGLEEEDEEDDDEVDEDEYELASTLLQLIRDNARLETLNASYVEKIIAQRDSCTHLKVLLRMNSCAPLSPLSSSG